MKESEIAKETRVDEPKMAKSLQVWYSGKLLDVVSAEQAREMIKNGVARQISVNEVVMTPQRG